MNQNGDHGSRPSQRAARRPPVVMPRIALDRQAGEPVYRQIMMAIQRDIADGTIPDGMRLPPERQLAEALSVDRTTVVAAYRDLAAGGWVTALVGRGTVVNPPTVWAGERRSLPDAAIPPVFCWAPSLTSYGDAAGLGEEFDSPADGSGVLSLATTAPNAAEYPVAEFRGLLGDLLQRGGEALLQYAPPEGLLDLRSHLARRMAGRGEQVTADDVLITAGSQQGLYLLARALVVPGDTVAVESPTYLGAIDIFRSADAHLVTTPGDRDGIDPLRLDAMLGRRRVKLLYLLPTYQNPTGQSLSLDRRRQIVAVAARHGIPIIEDDPYSDLRYDGERLPSLFALAGPAGGVAYLSTFSKVLFPGFRIGWVAGAAPLIGRVRREKQLVDLDSNAVIQAAFARYLSQGLLDEHLAAMRPAYRARRDTLIATLDEGLSGQARWDVPQGGFSLWLELESGLRARDVLTEAIRRGVLFVPGDVFHVDGGGRSSLRLSFSGLSEGDLAIAGRRLAEAIRVVAGRRSRTVRRGGPIVWR